MAHNIQPSNDKQKTTALEDIHALISILFDEVDFFRASEQVSDLDKCKNLPALSIILLDAICKKHEIEKE